MLRFPAGLVLIEYDGMLCVPACPVQPHIALGLGLLSRLPEHLEGGLIRMEHLALHQPPVQHIIHRLQPVLRRPQHPVGHSLPGELEALPSPLLLLPV